MAIFKDDEPVSKELRDYRRRLICMGFTMPPFLIIPLVFSWEYFSSNRPDYPVFGVDGLYDALVGAYSLLYVAFSSIISIPLVGTWINIRRSNLQHAIVSKVDRGMGVGIKHLDPNCTDASKFSRADDEKLVMRIEASPSGFIFPVILFLIPLCILFIRIWIDDIGRYDAIWITISIVVFCTLVYNLSFPKRRIEFNRLEGTVTVPRQFLPFHQTLPFDKIQVNAYMKKFQMCIPYRFLAITLIGDYDQAQQWWSFYMWYMDKNRPLPNGTLLDAHRQRDYLRRREEGFPTPLYPATIDTPEWKEAHDRYFDLGAKERYLVSEK